MRHPALEFLWYLDASDEATFNIESFSDLPKGVSKPTPDPLSNRYPNLTLDGVEQLIPNLSHLNNQGAAIYVAVNEFKGQRSKANIARIRGIHADLDEVTEEVVDAIRNRLKPSLEVRSSRPTNLHFYWLLSQGEALSAERAESLNKALSVLGADKAAVDISRLLRLPGFRHMKNAESTYDDVGDQERDVTTIVAEISRGPRYTSKQIAKAFPEAVQKITSKKKAGELILNRKVIDFPSWPAEVRSAIKNAADSIAKQQPRLWGGQWESVRPFFGAGSHYTSQSEADLALAGLIAWNLSKNGISSNIEQVTEAVFERSALARRQKWQGRPDYRQRTLARACHNIYRRNADHEVSVDRDTRGDLSQQKNDSPLPENEVQPVVNSISRYEQDGSKEDSEDALALSFAKHNPELRYVALRGQWMQWNQTVWKPDTTLGVYDQVRRHVRDFAPNEPIFFKANTMAAVEKLAKSDRRHAATVEQWDADDHLLNTPGGIIDLNNGALQVAEPELYMSKSTSVGPEGEAPRWQEFLAEVTGGDIEYQVFLQRVIGYAASGFTHEHAMFFLYGEGGNGKGIFLNTIQAVMGDYGKVASMEAFTESKFDRHPTDMAMLHGARMVFAQETESGRAWAESRIKSLTGGDPITARYMRQDFFTYIPKFKLLISGNHMPKLRNVDEAMRRRLYLLPFTRTFKGKDRDPHLADKLLPEYGGILQWIVDGAVAYQQDGLNPPGVVIAATTKYFESEDFFQQWLADCCDIDPNAFESPGPLFKSFKAYAEAANDIIGTETEFRQRLDKAGFERGNSRAKGGRFWQGVRLKTPVGKPAGSDL